MPQRAHRPSGPHSPRTILALIAAVAVVVVAAAVTVRAWPRPSGIAQGRPRASGPSPAATPSSSSSFLQGSASPFPTPSAVVPVADASNIYAADAPSDFSPAVRRDPERVYVPSTQSGTVTEIDPKTFRIIKVLNVGGVPHHVTPSWDLKHLYVDNAGSGALQDIDPRTGERTDTHNVPSPYNLYFTPDGSKALVVVEYHQEIQFRDRRTWRVLKDLPIPGRGVDHMDFSVDGRYLLTSCEYTGLVVKVDAIKMRVVGQLDVGGRPIDVKLSPDGRVFYVANQGLSGVSVIDPVRMRKIAFIPTGVGAHGMAVSRDARFLYVSNRIAGTISVISFKRRAVVATWNVGGSPDMLQASPDGKQLWTTNRFGDTVSVISTVSGRVIHTILVGSEPHGLAYFPQPGRYSLGHNGVYR
jgi:YVTN family beta-propeller protein